MARTNNGSAGSYLSYSGAIVTAYPFTIAGWFKTTDNATFQVLWAESDTLNNEGILVGMAADGTIYQHVKHFSGSVSSTTSGTVSNNTWVHVAAVFASNTSRTPYLNGTAGTTSTDDWTATDLVITSMGERVFGDLTYSSLPLKGKMAHWAVWSTALSGANITSLAGGACPNTIGSPVAWWPLAGTSSPEPDDIASFDMTITGTMTADTGDNPTTTCGGGGGGSNHNLFCLLGVG